MPLPGTPHPKMVIQPLTFVALISAKIWAVKKPSTTPAIIPWTTSVRMEPMGLMSKHMKRHDAHDDSHSQGD
jgi:hypothetical protein